MTRDRKATNYLCVQGKTVLDPGYNTDGGLPTKKLALPQ